MVYNLPDLVHTRIGFMYGVLAIANKYFDFRVQLTTLLQLKQACEAVTCFYLCEQDDAHNSPTAIRVPVRIPSPVKRNPPFPFVLCPSGHTTHTFLALDQHSDCCLDDKSARLHSSHSNLSSDTACGANLDSSPRPFVCASGQETLPYSFVCDQRSDCMDQSDETFCHYTHCDLQFQFQCGDGKCIPIDAQCNYSAECADQLDEFPCQVMTIENENVQFVPRIVSLAISGATAASIDPPLLDNPSYCPDTHFACPHHGHCLPMNVRCNDINDCSGKEDEDECDTYVCPGFYRCRMAKTCVHVHNLCDGSADCPLYDDEKYCHLSCPHKCKCYGFSFVCNHFADLHYYPDLRDLNGADSGMSLLDVMHNTLLIRLSLINNRIHRINNVTLHNLRSLDLSNNMIREVFVSDFSMMTNLQVLSLAGNPLQLIFSDAYFHHSVNFVLEQLDLSETVLKEINFDVFVKLTNMHTLNMSSSRIEKIIRNRLDGLQSLTVLDVRGCPLVTFPKHLFHNMDQLQRVYADNYKLCCSAVLPGDFNLQNCHAPFDEISSCEALLRSNIYRFTLFIFVFLTLLGNLISFTARVVVQQRRNPSSYDVFVIHLCVADFLMGVYLVIIGVADSVYHNYVWQDVHWRHSVICSFAGFLSLMSCEVSAFIICFITIDRFLVLHFPFSQFHFNPFSAKCLCVVSWVTGALVALFPLLPVTSPWQFYSQTGLCIPLPVTRHAFGGQHYAFGIMIVLNFALFLIIALGQLFIYWSVQTSKIRDTDTTKQLQDARIARRLMTVVISDFLCWFPIGLLGVLAKSDVGIPSEVNVALAIFVLPLNSALNPFLYTLNMVQEKLQQSRENKLLKQLMEADNV